MLQYFMYESLQTFSVTIVPLNFTKALNYYPTCAFGETAFRIGHSFEKAAYAAH